MGRLSSAVGTIAGVAIGTLMAGLIVAVLWWLSGALYSWGLWPLGAIVRIAAVLATICAAFAVLFGLFAIISRLYRSTD